MGVKQSPPEAEAEQIDIGLHKECSYHIVVLADHSVVLSHGSPYQAKMGEIFHGQYELTTVETQPRHCFFVVGMEDYAYFDADKVAYIA